ncbi:MAG: SH3 domain-containing protein [Thermodesulfobacteriota bacterium]
MNYKILKIIIFLFVIILCQISNLSMASPFNSTPLSNINNPYFWINKIKNPDRLLLSLDQIQKMNEENLKNKEFLLCSVPSMKEEWTKKEILDLLHEDWEGFGKKEELRFGKNGIPLNDSFWEGIKRNWNLEALKEVNSLLFGMIVKRTDIRVFPTEESSLISPTHSDFDHFQHSMVAPGSLVGIYHFSRDHQWAYVQTSFIRGWVRTDDFAIAKRKDDFLKNEKDIVVITGNFVKIYEDPFFRQQALCAQMGSTFHLLSSSESTKLPSSCYVVRIPKKEADGFLSFRKGYIPISEEIHRGFLPYTQKNIALQAFKMLFHPYGWGEKGGGRDCSRFIMDIFNAFGFLFPRNSKYQAMIGTPLLPKGTLGKKEKQAALDQAIPLATLIRIPGHIMLYLGKHRGRYYVIHSLWGYQTGGDWIQPEIKKVGKVVISDLSIGKEGPQGSLFDRIIEIQFIGDESIVKKMQ